MSDTLGAVHDWVCNTLKNKDWSARKWAMQAGVAPSTLQRFIAEKPWCLSQTVISKLASISGTYPDVSPKVLVSKIKSLPVMAYKKGALMETNQTIVTTENISSKAFAIPVQTNSMDLAGFTVGDMIVVDPDMKPINGKAVLVQFKNKIQIMEYRTPYLLPRSSDKSQKELDNGLVDILGVVVQLIRNV
tara:strand:- start:330 stop:896 length:567 start_codon:yes stop_codon:yes gene_type:complete